MNNLLTIFEPDFRKVNNIEYFRFEEDFIEEGIRCIPMVVRFKMDIVGIKLKLAAWAKFRANQKMTLALMPVDTPEVIAEYDVYLTNLICYYTGKEADRLPPLLFEWARDNALPEQVSDKAAEFGWTISVEKWRTLTELQRFALLKLCRAGHENRNFPIAVKEFGIV